MSEEPFSHSQRFQQAITTTITCQTIIKYNSNLSAEQKEEVLREIASTLAFLEKRLEVNATIESSPALLPEKLVDLLDDNLDGGDEVRAEPDWPAREEEKQALSLQNLRRLYHAYLSDRPGRGVDALETRYKSVMEVLDQLQDLAAQGHDATAGDLTAEGLIHRVQGFVTAIYCMFREFAALLSNIVEGKSIDMDTEALNLVQKYPLASLQQQLVRDITPLVSVYSKHRQAQERRGALVDCTRDATAFLIFLQENLEGTLARYKEISAQIKATVSLFNELTSLLMDYEQAVANIMQAPSTSR